MGESQAMSSSPESQPQLIDYAHAPEQKPQLNLLRAFRSKNYRIYFIGQLISMMGSWLTITATSWLVYRLARQSMPEKAGWILSTVVFASQIPIFFLAPFCGVWLDRINCHRVLIVTQFLSMLQSFALAYLALRNVITIPQIIALQLLQGIINALDVPARQSFVVDLVEKREDLPNAIAMSSSIVHAARLIGPTIAGYLIFFFRKEGYCFLVDGFSYLAVLIALMLMKVKHRERPKQSAPLVDSFAEGFKYAFGFPPIRVILMLVALTSLMAISLSTLMPIVADRVLGGRERLYGMALGAAGVGAFLGTMYLASRKSVHGLLKVIGIANLSLGLGIILFSFSRTPWISIPLLVVTGGSMVIHMASCNTIVQTIVDDDKRGRIMSIFSMCFMGIAPFGSLLAGRLTDTIGAPHTILTAGTISLIGGTILGIRLRALHPMIRPIFMQRGVIPEVAQGVQSSANAVSSGQD